MKTCPPEEAHCIHPSSPPMSLCYGSFYDSGGSSKEYSSLSPSRVATSETTEWMAIVDVIGKTPPRCGLKTIPEGALGAEADMV